MPSFSFQGSRLASSRCSLSGRCDACGRRFRVEGLGFRVEGLGFRESCYYLLKEPPNPPPKCLLISGAICGLLSFILGVRKTVVEPLGMGGKQTWDSTKAGGTQLTNLRRSVSPLVHGSQMFQHAEPHTTSFQLPKPLNPKP